MIRITLIMLFVTVFFFFSIFIFGFLGIVGWFSQTKKDSMSYAIVVWALSVVRFISGADVTVIGKERIPKDTAVLYAANHRSYFDIVFGYMNALPRLGFVSKIEMKKVPFLAGWMKRVNCLFLDRSNAKAGVKMILDGADQLKRGISVFIFPEGTRGKSDDALKSFKEGSMKMAIKAGVPIVPVAFSNTGALFEDHFPRVEKQKVCIEFGEPIYLDNMTQEEKKHVGAMAHDAVEKMLIKNKEIIKR